jgi:hypothetical protein
MKQCCYCLKDSDHGMTHIVTGNVICPICIGGMFSTMVMTLIWPQLRTAPPQEAQDEKD